MIAKEIKIAPDDSLNVILSYIKEAKEKRLIIKLPRNNDLATSLIGLKTLYKKVLETGKLVVLLVDNKTTLQLAQKAGFAAVSATEDLTPALWSKIKKTVEQYKISQIKPAALQTGPKEPPKVVLGKTVNKAVNSHSISKVPRGRLIGTDVKALLKANNAVADPVAPRQITKHVDDFKRYKKDKRKSLLIGFLKLTGIIVGTLLFLGGISAYLYYKYVPRVYITLNLKQDTVKLNTKVVATLATTGFDMNKREIPLIEEKVVKSGSTTIKATEQKVDGSYAQGQIQVNNNSSMEITVPKDTEFVSDNGLKYKSVADVTVAAGSSALVTVQAEDYGKEYNIEAGHTFSLNPPIAQVTAANVSAFSGGDKKTYIVLGKKDVEKGVEDLKKALVEEALTELETMDKDKGYKFIKDSLKSKLVDDYKVDPAIGTKTSDAYLEVKIECSGLYYHQDSLEELVKELLLKGYREKLKLGADALLQVNNLTVNVKKVSIAKDRKSVEIEVDASGSIVTKVDTALLKQNIVGKSWEQMEAYLKGLPYLATTPVIRFEPPWMPQSWRYVPKEPNRISIIVQSK